MAYATVTDVQARMTRTLSEKEMTVCETLLDDAGIRIDTTGTLASDAVKKVVSCNMVIRALGNGDIDVPTGATQGSMSGLGYSQSWTISNGSVGELYFSKDDRRLLKLGNAIGSYSPVQELAGVIDAGNDYPSA
jgi:hypothetical protein